MFISHACSLHVINHCLISRMNIIARLDGFKGLSLWHCRENSWRHDNCEYQEFNALYILYLLATLMTLFNNSEPFTNPNILF